MSEAFFGGYQVKEAPTTNHVPIVDGEGFVDRREGLEDWPQLWQPDKNTFADCVSKDSENVSGHDFNVDKHILQPKSRKNKARLQDPVFPGLYNYASASPSITAPAVQPVRLPVRAPGPLIIRKKNRTRQAGQANRVNKRSARDSFVTRSTTHSPKPDGKLISAPLLLTSPKD